MVRNEFENATVGSTLVMECLNQFYSNYDEEGRLLSKYGQIEYNYNDLYT